MKKFAILVGLVLVAGLIGYVGISFLSHGSNPVPANAATTTVPYAVPALTKTYSNSTYGFSLKMPENFSAQEIQNTDDSGNPNGETIVLQDSADNGVQIVVSPFSDDAGNGYTLTQDRILQDVPDLAISDAQPVNIGTNYQGLAFKSNNDAFGGDSREVWFVFHGNLYQVSTYSRLDDLLKAIFGTWNFQ